MFRLLKVVGGSLLAFSVLLILAARYVKPGAAAAAQTERQVRFHIANKFEPVVVTKITAGNVAVQAGRFIKPAGEAQDPITPFSADDDWIRNLTVYVLNRTNRTIVYASLNLGFPETTVGQTQAFFPLFLGRIPESIPFDSHGAPIRRPEGSQPIRFRPGQTMAIHLGDYIDQIRARVEPMMPFASLTAISVNFGRFFFADGMSWSGRFRAMDPQGSTWREMDPDYFPGDPDGRWPGRPGWVDR
jgi:hypothetical protein